EPNDWPIATLRHEVRGEHPVGVDDDGAIARAEVPLEVGGHPPETGENEIREFRSLAAPKELGLRSDRAEAQPGVEGLLAVRGIGQEVHLVPAAEELSAEPDERCDVATAADALEEEAESGRVHGFSPGSTEGSGVSTS